MVTAQDMPEHDPRFIPFIRVLLGRGMSVSGDTFTARFPEPGIYPFMDVFERGMTGVVVVLAADE